MKRLFRVEFVCLGLLLAPGFAGAVTVDEVLAQLRAASGGHAWNGVKQLEMSGTLSVGTLKGSIHEIDSLVDDRSATQFDLKVTAGAQGTGDGVSWQSSDAGLVDVDSTDTGRRAAITNAFISTRAFLKQDIHRFRPQMRHEPGFEVVSVTPDGGDTIEFWVNARSYLIDRIAVPSTKTLTLLADYRDTHGLMLPFRIESHDVDDVEVVVVTSYTFGPVIDDTRLQRPRSVLKDLDLATKVTLPIHVEGGHVYVQASINDGAPAFFVLDTGAGANVVTPAAAVALHLRAAGELDASGVGEQRVSAGLTKVTQLHVGPATFQEQTFAIAFLPPLDVHSAGRVEPAAGLLGYDFFRRLRVTIDYDDSTVTLEPLHACEALPKNAVRLNIGANHVPLVPVSIDGAEAWWNLDLGDAAALTLSSAVAQRVGVPHDAGVATVNEGGVGGVSRERLLQFNEAAIGPFKLTAPIAAISDQRAGEFARPNFGGNLGYGVLRNFQVGFDYECGMLVLTPSRAFGKPMPYNGLGATWKQNPMGVLTVLHVMSGSPAEAAGLQAGDELVAAGSVSGNLLTRAFMRDLQSQPVGTKIALQFKRGNRVYRQEIELTTFIPKFNRGHPSISGGA